MSREKPSDRYKDQEQSLRELPHISDAQVEQWIGLQRTID